MTEIIKVAVLGSTGYVGLELVKILANHPFVKLNFLGCENFPLKKKLNLNKSFKSKIPNLSLNKEFNPSDSDLVFLALPHGIAQKIVKKIFNKIKIIDMSADFRLDEKKIYEKNYKTIHTCPELLDKFVYGLAEVNKNKIIKSNYISVPGCYPTSVLTPIIPLLKNKLISSRDIIIDSKSGYSGAGKKFNIKNIKNSFDLNFYNYNTNTHRHICEIQQELDKFTSNKIKFSFNPHVLPSFRGMMSTIYCNLSKDIKKYEINKSIKNFYKDKIFVKILDEKTNADFFKIQNTNNCIIKIFYHRSDKKIIIVSLIDNLLKGAAGQAIQCFNLMYNFTEDTSLKKFK